MAEREVKDSGIDWIGLIPAHWETKRLQFCLHERNVKNFPIQTKEILSLSVKKGITLYSEREGGGNKAKEDLTAYKVVKTNDIVMNSMNVLEGAVNMSPYDGCVSPVYYIFNSPNFIETCYFNLLFQTKAFQKSLFGLGNGILIKESSEGKYNTIRMRIPIDKLKRVKLPYPPYEEAKKIVSFLSKRVNEIDALTTSIEKQIETLQEFKKSLITEVVTKGLNPNVEMKTTGYHWINSVPSTWKCEPLKRSFSFGKGLPITKADLVDEGISVLSYGQIHSKNNKGYHLVQELIRYVVPSYQDEYPNCLAKQGDILMADTSEDLEGIGNSCVNDIEIPLFAGYHTLILRNRNINLKSRYCAYLFLSQNWRNQLRALANGIKVFSITQKILKQVQILIPPVEEQNKIVDYLDHRCCEIEKIISDKEKQIEVLAKYKQSLIYEVVTGKKEIE